MTVVVRKGPFVILAVLFTLLGICAALLISDRNANLREDEEYKILLAKLPQVESVQDYISHEYDRFADLDLTGGRSISIGWFDKSSFYANDELIISKIGNLDIICREENDSDSIGMGVFRLSQIEKYAPRGSKIKNLSDLLNNYDSVYRYFKETLPDGQSRLKKTYVNGNWCFRRKELQAHLPSRG